MRKYGEYDKRDKAKMLLAKGVMKPGGRTMLGMLGVLLCLLHSFRVLGYKGEGSRRSMHSMRRRSPRLREEADEDKGADSGRAGTEPPAAAPELQGGWMGGYVGEGGKRRAGAGVESNLRLVAFKTH